MTARRRQRGSVLLQAALLIFGLMGVAALIVDLGIVRATQGSMVVAADVAALEGLRGRDLLVGPGTLENVNMGADRDRARRLRATRAARGVFDEDLDFGTPNVALSLGAGPVISTGVAGVSDPAGGLLTTDGTFLPVLQLNLARNAQEGDLVAGEFRANLGTPRHHEEFQDYSRGDFEHSLAADAPSAPSFLARLRRTNDVLGLDQQEGISSSGPTLPFLFGLGTALGATDPDVYDPRRDGLTIRATAISDARVAVAAGFASATVRGVSRIGQSESAPSTFRFVAFDDLAWRSELPAEAVFSVTISRSGEIFEDPSALPVGFAQLSTSLVRVGDQALPTESDVPVEFPSTLDELDELLGLRYVALYSDSIFGVRITGFAAMSITSAEREPSGDPTLTLSLRKLGSLVAPENASAVPLLATDVSALLPPSPDRGALLAPVLVR